MTKAAYVGVDGKARKIKSGYVGVDSKARKIKKAYVGVGGIARPFWGSEKTVSYYGAGQPLSSNVAFNVAASVGDYAIFAGGQTMASNQVANTTAYSSSLVKSTPSNLSSARSMLAATSNGAYAIFGGGRSSNKVDAYNPSLVRTTPSTLSKTKVYLAAANIGDYAIFAGGDPSNLFEGTDTVDAYNKSLVKTVPTPLSIGRCYLYGASNSAYALFSGGSYGGLWNLKQTNAVDAYNKDLVRSLPQEPDIRMSYGATAGDCAVFLANADVSYAYDNSLVRNIINGCINSVDGPLVASSNGVAIYCGGSTSNSGDGIINISTMCNFSLVFSLIDPISVARYSGAGTSVGNYLIVGGGKIVEVGDGATNATDIYMIS